MDGKRVMRLTTIIALIAVVAVLTANVATALAAPPAAPEPRVDVLIGFTRTPGPAEQALVRGLGGRVRYSYRLVPAVAANLPEAAVAALERNPNVTVVEPDMRAWAVDFTTELTTTWSVEHIGAGTAHAADSLGAGVRVAVIDSGIDCSHPDLTDNCVGGWDFVNGDDDPTDDYGHGTHVAGTIAAVRDGSGVVGVAPEAELYALKVLAAGGYGYASGVIAALEWAVDIDIWVTNLSLGWDQDPGTLVRAAFDNAYAAGLLNVCAAGNSGNPPGKGDSVIYPAAYDSCVAVAATDAVDARASFSSTGEQVELAAPGVAVYSTWPVEMTSSTYDPQPECDGTVCYKVASGTSMASPHVAGAAALAWAANSELTNEQVRAQLRATADDLGAAGWDPQFGYGLVDADEAAPAPVDVHDVAVTGIDAPSSVMVGESVAVDVTVENVGNQDIAADIAVALTDDTDDGTIGSQAIIGGLAAGASTTLTFSWNTETASLGDHTLTAGHDVVDDNPGNDALSVTVAVSEPGEPGTTMHVADLDGRVDLKGKSGRWEAFVTVTIHDQADAPVANATVAGTWSGATSGTVSGITAGDGTVTFTTGGMSGGTEVTFTVTDVQHNALTYDATANYETSITVIKP